MRTGATAGRRWLRSLVTAAVTAGVAVVMIGSATTASASVRPMGVGYASGVTAPTAIRAAPSDSTYYVGTAQPGDNIADICYVATSAGFWDLVLERTGAGGDHFGNTVGFLPESSLLDDGRNQVLSCGSYGYTDYLLDNPRTMRSAPTTASYAVGTASTHDFTVSWCWIQDSLGVYWNLMYDVTGSGGDHLPYTAGMIPSDDIETEGGNPGPCGQS